MVKLFVKRRVVERWVSNASSHRVIDCDTQSSDFIIYHFYGVKKKEKGLVNNQSSSFNLCVLKLTCDTEGFDIKKRNITFSIERKEEEDFVSHFNRNDGIYKKPCHLSKSDPSLISLIKCFRHIYIFKEEQDPCEILKRENIMISWRNEIYELLLTHQFVSLKPL